MADEETRGLIGRLDRCVLAYHVYNQSLLWPLDPWYERWSRPGSSRRDNMLAAVHAAVAGRATLRGPGSVRPGWPHASTLDPVIADYRRVAPWHGALTFDGQAHRLFVADPAALADVAAAEVVEHGGPPGHTGTPLALPPVRHPAADPSAGGRLQAFEGITGAIEGRPGAWGLLGIVLDRRTDDGYEVEIVFRGSQSGDAYRAAYLGFVREGGNADWVTDMELFKTVTDPAICPHGAVVTGLRDALSSALAPLGAALVSIEARRGGPPSRIHVTGHSLGGALATQFAAGAVAGSLVRGHLAATAHWPWASLGASSFGAPKVGDERFAACVDDHLDLTRVWVAGDPITRFPTNAHVGRALELTSDVSGTATHEPSVIRSALVARLADAGHVPPDPWRSFTSLGAALRDAHRSQISLAELFPPDPDGVALHVELAAQVIGERSSYRVPWTKTRRELRGRQRRLLGVFDGPTRSLDELESRVGALHGVQPDSEVERHLQHVLIVREAVAHGWTIPELLSRPVVAASLDGDPAAPAVSATGAVVSDRDRKKIERLVQMRLRHHQVVHDGRVRNYRRRHVPTSAMPPVRRSCEQHPNLPWLPPELVLPAVIPPEGRPPKAYLAAYYGTGKLGWDLYHRRPIDQTIAWDPSLPWNHAFPPTADGWEDPTSDATFTRLRLQGPNPFALRRSSATPSDAQGQPIYEVDFGADLDGVLPAIVARFVDAAGGLEPLDISIGGHRHRRGDATWDGAKRVVNAADARLAVLGRHLLDVHFIVGQAYALAAFRLPTWHRLRPFMQFFTYGTLTVNEMAYRSLLVPSSYFVASGFFSVTDARHLFRNRVAAFDLDDWIVPRDLERRGLDGLAGSHPWADDARLVWPAFVDVVARHLDDLRLDDAAIARDRDLHAWHDTLADLLPGTDVGPGLDRQRLEELCTALLWNNVVHEVCGDFSPIMGSEDPADKATVDLAALRRHVDDGRLGGRLTHPSMASVFLIDQASWVSRFNVGGNSLLRINAARWVDDPKLRVGIERFQSTLQDLDDEIAHRNRSRVVANARMLPRHWEASVSF